jgi:ribosomal protein S27E
MCIPCPICIGTIVATAAGAAAVIKKIKKQNLTWV